MKSRVMVRSEGGEGGTKGSRLRGGEGRTQGERGVFGEEHRSPFALKYQP